MLGDQFDEFLVNRRGEFTGSESGAAHGPFDAGPFLALEELSIGGNAVGDFRIGADHSHFLDDGQ